MGEAISKTFRGVIPASSHRCPECKQDIKGRGLSAAKIGVATPLWETMWRCCVEPNIPRPATGGGSQSETEVGKVMQICPSHSQSAKQPKSTIALVSHKTGTNNPTLLFAATPFVTAQNGGVTEILLHCQPLGEGLSQRLKLGKSCRSAQVILNQPSNPRAPLRW